MKRRKKLNNIHKKPPQPILTSFETLSIMFYVTLLNECQQLKQFFPLFSFLDLLKRQTKIKCITSVISRMRDEAGEK